MTTFSTASDPGLQPTTYSKRPFLSEEVSLAGVSLSLLKINKACVKIEYEELLLFLFWFQR